MRWLVFRAALTERKFSRLYDIAIPDIMTEDELLHFWRIRVSQIRFAPGLQHCETMNVSYSGDINTQSGNNVL